MSNPNFVNNNVFLNNMFQTDEIVVFQSVLVLTIMNLKS